MDTSFSKTRLFFEIPFGMVGLVSAGYGLSKTQKTPISNVLGGIESLVLAKAIDYTLRYLFSINVPKAPVTYWDVVSSPLIEEFWSVLVFGSERGIDTVERKFYTMSRLVIGLLVGSTATRAFVGEITPEQNKQGIQIDTKMGFLWTVSRELFLYAIPSSKASRLALDIADSCIFAFAEIAVKNGESELPRFDGPWKYKVISAFSFRLIANWTAQKHGIGASLVQHYLYNISCAL